MSDPDPELEAIAARFRESKFTPLEVVIPAGVVVERRQIYGVVRPRPAQPTDDPVP
jgi:hypothetical protein